MTPLDIMALIDRSLYADLAYIDEDGKPVACRFYCVWHRGIGRHIMSTGTVHKHSRCLMNGGDACLYFGDESNCANVSLSGRCYVRQDHDLKALLWFEGDEHFFPLGVDDPTYCVLEFEADSLRYYYEGTKGGMDSEAIAAFDAGRDTYVNGYKKTHPEG